MVNEHALVDKLVDFVQNTRGAASDRHAALWALGHIGSSANGFTHLSRKDPDVVSKIMHIASSDGDLSIRGSCFCVMGMISRASKAASRELHKLEWGCPKDPALAIAIPEDLSSIFNFNDHTYDGSPTNAPAAAEAGSIAGPSEDEDVENVIRLVTKLACSMYTKEAKDELTQLRRSNASIFKSPTLERRAHELFEAGSFTLASRRFVHDLLADH